MHAKDYTLNAVLSERQQWVVPVYQRHYAWEAKEDKQIPNLWEDIRGRAIERLEDEELSPHFMGAIIYSEPADQPFGAVNRRHLVDGQQRISTFCIALCAVREIAEINNLPQIASAASAYVYNEAGSAMSDPERERFKLWSSSHDRPYFVMIADGGLDALRSGFEDYFYKNGKLILGKAPKMISAYWYLLVEMRSFLEEQAELGRAPQETLNAILHGFLNGFQIVVVQLGKQDDAQGIFASLNGRAEPLSAFDLIRNDIFHRASKQFEDEDKLYEGSWKRLETEYWKTEVKQGRLKRPRTDHLLVHTLVAEEAKEINIGNVANEYSGFAKRMAFESVEQEVSALLAYADIYEALDRKDPEKPEARIARMLSVWDFSAFHPLVMWIGRQSFGRDEKQDAYRLIESYIVRRDLCGLTRKNYNKVVPGFLRAAKLDRDSASRFVTHMLSLEGDASRMPADSDVIRSVVSRSVYNDLGSQKLRYILRELELDCRTRFDESVSLDTDKLTIEHIMPQKWADNWSLPNGVRVDAEEPSAVNRTDDVSADIMDLMETRERLKHTLGNLTIVTGSLNPAMGKAAWDKKRPYLSRSLLTLNRDVADTTSWKRWGHELVDNPEWSEVAIQARGRYLANKINVLWPVNIGPRK